MFIYKIRNLLNGKEYIGQTIQPIYKRWLEHVNLSKHVSSRNKSALLNAIKKYGEYVFEIELLCIAINKEQLNILEQMLIEKYNTISPNGYNLTKGGEGLIGYKFSNEQKKHLSKIRKCNITEPIKAALALGRSIPMSKEARERLSKDRKGKLPRNFNLSFAGRKHSEETKAKMKAAHSRRLSGI